MKTEQKAQLVSRESDQFKLRLPEGMRLRIAEAADANKRSMNSEIVERLEQSLADPALPHDAAQIHLATLKLIEKLTREVEHLAGEVRSLKDRR